ESGDGSTDARAAGGEWELVPDQEPLRAETTMVTGEYVFKSIPTYVADPNADPSNPEDDRRKFLADYRLRIDQSALAALERDWGVTLRARAFSSDGSHDRELDSDASTQAVVGSVDGENAYYLNEEG